MESFLVNLRLHPVSMSRIMESMSSMIIKKTFRDVLLICSDGSVNVDKLTFGLLFPYLADLFSGDRSSEVFISLPDYQEEEVIEAVKTIVGLTIEHSNTEVLTEQDVISSGISISTYSDDSQKPYKTFVKEKSNESDIRHPSDKTFLRKRSSEFHEKFVDGTVSTDLLPSTNGGSVCERGSIDLNNYHQILNEQGHNILIFAEDQVEACDQVQENKNCTGTSRADFIKSYVNVASNDNENQGVPFRGNDLFADVGDELESIDSDNIIGMCDEYDTKYLKVGMRFPSREESTAFIQFYCNTNLSPMVTARSTQTSNKSLLTMVYKCPHGIKKRSSKSTGKRKKKGTSFVGCPVHVNIQQQASDGTFLVTRADVDHKNHEIGKEIFERYIVHKRLSEDHEDAVISFLESNPSNREVAHFLKDITGKHYSVKDAANLINRLKKLKKL